MHRAVEVLWLSGTAAGYTDLFPIEEFGQDVAGAERLHLVRGPHGGGHHARYKLTIAGLTATLDYGAFADFNVRNGMEVGVMTFEFADSDRSVVRAVRWNKEPVGSSEATITTRASNEPVAAGAVIAKQQQAIAEQVLRPGQGEFRQLLDLVYGARCCISGCSVPWALEAAHITPFADDANSNSPSNGLMLRADIHALFDSNQLAIHPHKRVVFFSPETTVWSEYSKLHGREKLAEPQPGFSKHAPSTSALKPRWAKFVQVHGSPDDAA